MEISPLMYQVPEACRHLRVGRSLFYDLIAARRLVVVKIGTRTLVPATELNRLAAELLAEALAKVAV